MPWRDDEIPADDATQLGFDSIGRMILRLRYRSGWTQRELQARSGVDQSVICRLENGKLHGIRWKRFARLVGTLGGVDPRPDPARPQRPPAP